MTAPKPRTVLVTGGTGLLGRYLLRELARDPSLRLRATRRASTDVSPVADLDVEWVEGELDDPDFVDDALAGVSSVVHAAALVSFRKRDRAALRRVNVDATAALADAALERGVGHFLHVSSVAAISPSAREAPVGERPYTFFPQSDTSFYARSKFDAEREVWRAREEGLAVTVLNPSVVLGVGDWVRSSDRLFAWVARGQRFYPRGGTGYVDARDVAAFAKTCLDAGPADRRFVVSAENWRYERFFRVVANALEVPPPTIPAKPWQAEFVWRGAAAQAFLTGGEPVVTRESARRSMAVIEYDNSASLAAGATYRPVAQTIWDVARAYQTRP